MPRMRSNKREMFEEIYRRYLLMRKDYPDKSVYELVTKIVNQPAPKFYLTPRTVGEFIYRIKNGMGFPAAIAEMTMAARSSLTQKREAGESATN